MAKKQVEVPKYGIFDYIIFLYLSTSFYVFLRYLGGLSDIQIIHFRTLAVFVLRPDRAGRPPAGPGAAWGAQ